MRLGFRLRQLAWDLQASLWVRPMLILLGLGGVAVALTRAEAAWAAHPSMAALERWLAVEPAAAQLVLATLAGSLMTVVSVVYSILLVALSLASMQFSTRVLAGFMRDRVAQHTLGLLLGSFVYCLLALRAVQLDPPFVPGVALSGAVGLAVASLLGLVLFIHHIVRGIQANHLIDRVARETAEVIDAVFVGPSGPALPPPPAPDHTPVLARQTGYIQLVDQAALVALARDSGAEITLLRAMGHFVPTGAPLLAIAPARDATPALIASACAAVDLGPVRTAQDDVEWGFRQIVDIALKALSPAVNDPSTAATCVDHLSALLLRAEALPAPSCRLDAGEGRVWLPRTSVADLVDLAFDQIRQYARTDMAVTLRLARAMAEVARRCDDPAAIERLRVGGRLLGASAEASFPPEDRVELRRRLDELDEALRPLG